VRRARCGACGCADLLSFLDLGESPIADAYTARPNDAVRTYPLELAVCRGCRLVQLLEVVDSETLFGSGYSFYSSASLPVSTYQAEYAAYVLDRYRSRAVRLIVEIGCNDGDLLRHFDSAGCCAIGVDPADGPVSMARARGLDLEKVAFNQNVAAAIRAKQGPAGVIIANHVLAHVPEVADVLAGIERLLDTDGIAIIEVRYLPDLLVNNAFDLVYHEHRNFFSLASLRAATAPWGLHVIDARLTGRQGGSLRVTISRQPVSVAPAVEAIERSEHWLSADDAYAGLQGHAERIRARLCELLDHEAAAGRTVAGYGAPAKATTLMNYCGIAPMLTHVIDTTTAKQHRYIPGTGLEIVAPGARPHPDTYLLLAWNYLSQIVRGNRDFKGGWIVPIPTPIVL
jgi:SAM-dependent methyltransferase